MEQHWVKEFGGILLSLNHTIQSASSVHFRPFAVYFLLHVHVQLSASEKTACIPIQEYEHARMLSVKRWGERTGVIRVCPSSKQYKIWIHDATEWGASFGHQDEGFFQHSARGESENATVILRIRGRQAVIACHQSRMIIAQSSREQFWWYSNFPSNSNNHYCSDVQMSPRRPAWKMERKRSLRK